MMAPAPPATPRSQRWNRRTSSTLVSSLSILNLSSAISSRCAIVKPQRDDEPERDQTAYGQQDVPHAPPPDPQPNTTHRRR